MNLPLAFSLLLACAAASHAQVVRCVDAAGKVSYGDTACAAGARRSELLLGPEATERPAEPEGYRRQEQLDGVERASQAQRESVEAVQRQAQPPGGPVVLDRGNNRNDDARDSDRQRRDADIAADEAWRSNGGGVYGRPLARPQDMRPRLRSCDAAGCRDSLGNHYDRGGKVDRFVRPDGRTCRPVGTTVVCN